MLDGLQSCKYSPPSADNGDSRNEKNVVIYDDYNGRIKADQTAIGTITTNIGTDAPRNGTKIVEFENGEKAADGDGITLYESVEWGGKNPSADVGDLEGKQDESRRGRVDGITLGQTNNDDYRRGPLENLSRTLRAGANGGVVEWET